MFVVLDEKDQTILDLLRENSRLSMNKIAKKSGIPLATVHHRIKKLEKQGIISKYTIKLNWDKLGKNMVVYILVKAVQRADQPKMLEEIIGKPMVEDGAVLTGEYDLIFRVRVRDIEELNEFVINYLRKIDGVAETRTMISLKYAEK